MNEASRIQSSKASTVSLDRKNSLPQVSCTINLPPTFDPEIAQDLSTNGCPTVSTRKLKCRLKFQRWVMLRAQCGDFAENLFQNHPGLRIFPLNQTDRSRKLAIFQSMRGMKLLWLGTIKCVLKHHLSNFEHKLQEPCKNRDVNQDTQWLKGILKGAGRPPLKHGNIPFGIKRDLVFFFFSATVSDFSYSSRFMELANILYFRLANPIKSEESIHILLACQSAYGVRKTQFPAARSWGKGTKVWHRIFHSAKR